MDGLDASDLEYGLVSFWKLARISEYHLLCSHADSLDGELAPTHVEQVLQARPQKIDDEDVVQALLPKVVYLRDTGCMTMMVI